MNMQEIIATLLDYIIRIPMVLVAIVIHEMAHGFAAYKMGDDTAKNAGRLSINPLKHIDVIGAISMFLFNFGWAKAVPINPYRFKNRRKGMIIVSLAGPLANVVLAFILMVLMYIIALLFPCITGNGAEIIANISVYLDKFYLMNLCFAVFNLIPIPPLDGSKIIGAFLPEDKFRTLMQYENLGMIFLIILIAFSERFDILNEILVFGVNLINKALFEITSFIFYFAR